MKRTLNAKLISELENRIATHHSLNETIIKVHSLELRHNKDGGELFANITRETEKSQVKNGEYIYELLNELYCEWSGIEELQVKLRKETSNTDEYTTALLEAEEAIYNEHEAIAGTVNFFDIGKEYIRIFLPKDFMFEIMEVVPYFEIKNDDELGIL